MSVLDFLDEHKSEIAFGAGLILTGAATVLSVKATPKAMEDICAAEKELDEPLTKWGKVKACWKRYILPVATEIAGVTCLCFGKSIDMKNVAMSTAAADVSQKLLTEYGRKVAEEIGEKKNNEIKKGVLADRAKHVEVRGSEDCSLMDGDSWFNFPIFNKRCVSNRVDMGAALNYVNGRLNSGEPVSYNDFFEKIIDSKRVPINEDLLCDAGDILGFDPDSGLVDIEFEPQEIYINGMKTVAYTIIFTYERTGNVRYPELITA